MKQAARLTRAALGTTTASTLLRSSVINRCSVYATTTAAAVPRSYSSLHFKQVGNLAQTNKAIAMSTSAPSVQHHRLHTSNTASAAATATSVPAPSESTVTKQAAAAKTDAQTSESPAPATVAAASAVASSSVLPRWLTHPEHPKDMKLAIAAATAAGSSTSSLPMYREYLIIALIFAVTGSSAVFLIRPLISYFTGITGTLFGGPWQYQILYVCLLSPSYAMTLFCLSRLTRRQAYFDPMIRRIYGRMLPNSLVNKIFGPAPVKR